MPKMFPRFAAPVLLLLLVSCKTYIIPVERFKAQLETWERAGKQKVLTQGPLGGQRMHTTYAADSIYAVDKKGQPVRIAMTPAVEIRITDTLNQSTVFYFDLVRLDGANIVGGRSRIVSVRKTIPINSIKKIEVQNGGKAFRYVQ